MGTHRAGPHSVWRTAAESPWARQLVIFVVVLVLISWWHQPAIVWPPYEDFAIALWAEADFLAGSNFDYYRLRYEEQDPAVVGGGSRAYVISVVPTLLAMLMRIGHGSTGMLITAHLVTFACATLIAMLLFAVVVRKTGTLAGISIAVAALTVPCFAVQTEMLGLDLPMTLFALATVWACSRRRYVSMSVFSLVAFLVKPTGAVVTLATCAFLTATLASGETASDDRRSIRLAWLLSLGGLILQALLLLWGGTLDARTAAEFRPQVASLSSMLSWCPDVVATVVVCAVGSLIVVGRRLLDARAVSSNRRAAPLVALGTVLDEYRVTIFAWLVLMALLLAISRVIFIPRYLTLAVPLLYIIAAEVLFSAARWRPVFIVLLVAVAIGNLFNDHGDFYPNLYELYGESFEQTNEFSPRASVVLERSYEYREDLRSTLRAICLLEEAGPRLLFADSSFAVFVSRPRIGYVETPLAVRDMTHQASAMAAFVGATIDTLQDPGHRPVIVTGGNAGFRASPPEGDDCVLYDDRQQVPLVAFAKNWPPDTTPLAVAVWYAETMIPGGHSPSFKREYFRLAIEHGELEQAVDWSGWALQQSPAHRKLRLLLIRLMIETGKFDEATDQAFTLLTFDPLDLSALVFLRQIQQRQTGLESDTLVSETKLVDRVFSTSRRDYLANRWQLARRQQAVESASAGCQFAMEQIVAGDHAEARETLEVVLQVDPHHVEASYLSGLIAFYAGDTPTAAARMSTVVQQQPDDYLAWYVGGLIGAERQNRQSAIEYLENAVRLQPRLAAAQHALGTLYRIGSDEQRALECFSAAIHAAPDFADAYQQRGRLRKVRGETELAAADFTRAAELRARVAP